jgi:hypothetical protein
MTVGDAAIPFGEHFLNRKQDVMKLIRVSHADDGAPSPDISHPDGKDLQTAAWGHAAYKP